MFRVIGNLLIARRDILARHADIKDRIAEARQEIEDGARPKEQRFKLS